MNAARLLVCYGGTFDPVHEGHLAVARSARDALDADVALVPARDPPHKGPTRADAAQRARMLELAVAGEAGLSVDLRELHREGPSYTFASLGELFGGSILAETVFSYPGLGSATIEAGIRGDVPLLLAITLLTTLFVSVGNTIADVLYHVADPRISSAREPWQGVSK